jgi:hypothetical protein
MISKESLEKFKRLYKERFKEELNDDEVLRRATRLLNLYRAVYLPLPYQNKNDDKATDSHQSKR